MTEWEKLNEIYRLEKSIRFYEHFLITVDRCKREGLTNEKLDGLNIHIIIEKNAKSMAKSKTIIRKLLKDPLVEAHYIMNKLLE